MYIKWAVYTEQGLETAQVQDAGSCQPIYSITKVFVNTCIGMLADVKSIRLDDNLLPYLQPYIRQDYPDVWNAVTIRQALAHRMGLDDGIFDIDRDDPRAYPTQDYLAYILQYPPKFQPGTHRKYTDCAHYLLSLLLETVTGKPADEYYLQKSAAAAAMPADCMDKMPRQSVPVGATGAYMRAEDVAKLGWLYVDQGESPRRQILSPAWVQQAGTRAI